MSAVRPSFGELVRAHRERVGLSQSELGDTLRLNRSYINRIENGQRTPSITVINRIAAAVELGVGDRIEFAIAAGVDLGVA